MEFACHEYSWSPSPSPLQTLTPPEKKTPAPLKQKKRAGRKVFNETRHPVYRGVRRKNGGKWVCEVREPNKNSRIWLGTFPSPEKAAVAHDVAALALRGRHAPLNFPDSAGRLPRPDSASHHDIQRAASEAAREFCHESSLSVSDDRDDVADDCWSCDQSRVGGDFENRDESNVFVDEEAMFNMPALLDGMAEGMLLTPLGMKKGFAWSQYEVDDDGIELNLWMN